MYAPHYFQPDEEASSSGSEMEEMELQGEVHDIDFLQFQMEDMGAEETMMAQRE